MKFLRYILLFLSWTLMVHVGAQSPVVEGKMLVKLNPAHSSFFDRGIPDELYPLSSRYGIKEVKPVFPFHSGDEGLDLQLWYELTYHKGSPAEKLKKGLKRTPFFDAVEPRFIGELSFVPDDSLYAQQGYLTAIGAEQAWDSTKGSTAVVVALLDAGVDTNHLDLKGKFWLNTSDPIDGVDNDNDGFLDNYAGWNFHENRGNIQYSSTTHGIQMAGALAANTNNRKGIAGTAYNCPMLVVNVVNNNNEVVYGYEGIKYAADKGCKVINCSWNIKAYSAFGWDVVQYANQKGALVVAAMGNNTSNDLNYPASFPSVLGLSGVDNNGFKVFNSNYHYSTNLSAPGLQILTTTGGNAYVANTGTSFSSVIASGAAALLASHKPTLTPLQLSSVIKASASDIYGSGQNSQYRAQLGTGMLHIGNAIKRDNSAFIEWVGYKAEDPKNGAIESGDTLDVEIMLCNYLNNSGKVDVVLLADNSMSTVVKPSISINTINQNDTLSNAADPLRVALDASIPLNEKLDFVVQVVHAGDTVEYGFQITVNPAFQEITTTLISSSAGNRGTFGWYEYPQKQGNGFVYKSGDQLLYEGGLMMGTMEGGLKVVDRIRGVRNVEQKDFNTTIPLFRSNESGVPFSLQGQFTDTGSTNEIGLFITQRVLAWPGENKKENFFVLEYTVKSSSFSEVKGLYLGVLADWDIEDLDKNRADYDDFRYLAYTYSTEGKGPYCGIQLLNLENRRKVYSLDHIPGGAGGIDITDNDVFSKSEKYTSMSTTRQRAGTQTGGNDVLQIISSGPHDIAAGDSLTFQVAILAADDLPQLQESADSAFSAVVGRIPNSVQESPAAIPTRIFPNPSGGLFAIEIDEDLEVEYEVTDLFGRTVLNGNQYSASRFSIDLREESSGLYWLKVQAKDRISWFQLIKN